MTDFDVQIFNDDINQSFAEFIKIWFFLIKDFQRLSYADLNNILIKTLFHSYILISWLMYTECM